MKATLLLLFLMQGVSPSPAPVDELVKKDGTRLVGELVSWNREGVEFKTSEGDTLVLSMEEISRLNLGETSIGTVAGMLPKPEPPRTPVQWTGNADAAFTGKSGTADTGTLALNLMAERKTKRYRLDLRSGYLYSESDGVLSSDQFVVGARLERFQTDEFFLYGSGSFETNEIELIDARAIFGVGVGYQLLDSERSRFWVSGGPGYTLEDHTDGTEFRHASAQAEQHFKYQLTQNLEVEQNFGYLQDLTEAERYKLRFDATLRTKLIHFLSFRVSVRNAYDNSPPEGANKNELIFLTGLGLDF